MLFVPPCGQSFEINEQLRLYYCPAKRKHREAQHLGIYARKAVRAIGEIAKVAICSVDIDNGVANVVDGDGPLTQEEQERVIEATREARRNRDWNIAIDHRFYLCDALEPTDFRKLSPQGIRNRRYFDLEEVLGGQVPADLAVLAEALRNQTWN